MDIFIGNYIIISSLTWAVKEKWILPGDDLNAENFVKAELIQLYIRKWLNRFENDFELEVK